MDACPGRLNQQDIFCFRNSTFYGQCSEICGINHGFMPISVKSVSLLEYIKFIMSLKKQTKLEIKPIVDPIKVEPLSLKYPYFNNGRAPFMSSLFKKNRIVDPDLIKGIQDDQI